MWKGRFATDTADSLKRFSESVSFDWRLYPHDIAGSIAHAKALLAAGIIDAKELDAIQTGLTAIGGEIAAGTFEFDPNLEDIHMNIEAALTRRIGPAGAKLHTARSRNDQVALDLRLFIREATSTTIARLRALQRSLVAFAERSGDAFLPGYTHLQRAQPVLFGHHLLAYVEMLARDISRLEDSKKRIEILPLGSGALAGSTIVLDRRIVAKELGFPEISANSMDAVSDRDFACEFLFALALLGTHLSRLAEDTILWASSEFGYIRLSDSYTTGSSLMPQKKNPDAAELARGKTGRLYGNLFSLLTVLKGLPMTYNRDLQEDKEAVFDSADTAVAILEVFSGMFAEAQIDADRMRTAASDPMLLATDLAEWLVLHGEPFRTAHECVGKLVRLSQEKKVPLDRLTLPDLRSVSETFTAGALSVFDTRRSLAARSAEGAPAPSNVAARIARWKQLLATP